MARILIAPTKNTQVKDKVLAQLKKQNHGVIDSNIDALDWTLIEPTNRKWTPQEAAATLLGNQAVKSAYADLERDMRQADACLIFFPATQDALMMAGWFAARHKDVVAFASGNVNLPLLAFMTTDLCLSVSEVLAAFSDR